MKYKVETVIVDKGVSTAEFKTLQTALDACFLFFSGVDFENRYNNCKYLEGLKQRNCARIGMQPNLKTWSISIEKVKE